jgi:hypothetical protein
MTTQLVDSDGTVIEHGHEVLILPRDAARILAVNVRTINNWATAGRLRFTKTRGGHKRYFADSIRAAYEGRWDDAATAKPLEDMHVCDVIQIVE